MTLISPAQAAELLFAAGRVPDRIAEVDALIAEQYAAHGGDPARFADELAQEYARHPQSAAAHMTRCLAAVHGGVELPDRTPDEARYTGLVDD